MIKEILTIAFFSVALIASCNEKQHYTKKPFFDVHNKYIGDSIFLNNTVDQIVFHDASYEIDSVVFNWYHGKQKSLKSVQTFKGGKNVFENIEYYPNKKVKKYSFIDEENRNFYYERLYDSNGTLSKINGYLFFQGFIIDTTSRSFDVKKGSTINYRIYYPNPPDCISRIYIKNDDGTVYDVFTRSAFLNFLQTVSQNNSTVGTYKVNIVLEQEDKYMDTTTRYSKALIYNVVP